MNFVRDIKVVQEFEERDDVYILTRDEITLDIALSKGGMGMYASRYNTIKDFTFDPPDDESVFDYTEEVVDLKDAYKKDEFYWAQNRLDPLTKEQEGIYSMIDTLHEVPAYKRFIWATKVITTGYVPAGPLDIGQVSTVFTGNPVEGTRLRLGIETSHAFTQKVQARSYIAYGFRDEKWKYRGSLLYTFNDDYRVNPRHYIEGSFRSDVVFPGMKLEFLETDNLLTSFRRGDANQMLFVQSANLDYFKENPVGFIKLGLEHRRREPYGALVFDAFSNSEPISVTDITTNEFSIAAEYSPNTSFIQGREIRTPIKSNFPRFQLSYRAGIKGLGGDYSYHNVSLQIKKRIPLSILGRWDFQAEIGRVFGSEIPYLLLHIPRANQAYSFQPTSFNSMNFMEFVTDKYARVNIQHFFDGYIFNRIPLWRKLKLKEVLGLKVIYGGLDDANDPTLPQNSHLIQFNQNADGEYLTTTFDSGKPFIEYSVGVYNIFRFIRLDFIKRVNYLDRPNVENLFGIKGLGLRGRIKVEF